MLSLWSVRMVCVWITVKEDTCCSNPYAGYVLDLKKLKVYNQYMFPLAMVLNMKL